MIEVVIESVRAGLMGQQRLAILREIGEERFLAIVIDPYIAEQIAYGMQEFEAERPMSHDLISEVIHEMNAKITRVEVVELKNQVYYGNIVIETSSGEILNIDSRSSDAIAMAVRTKAPIFVSAGIMDQEGIKPQEELPEIEDLTIDPPSQEHLSIFEDFIDNLDIDPTANDDNPKDD